MKPGAMKRGVLTLGILTLGALAGCGPAGLVPTTAAPELPSPQARSSLSSLSALYTYGNRNSSQWNKCGHAAAATILDHARQNPLRLPLSVYSPTDRRYHAANDAFVDGLAEKYPPDVAFGLAGTSPDRLAQMLSESGMEVHVSQSAEGGDLEGLERWLQAGWPVATLVDAGVLWDRPLVQHWSVVYAADSRTVRISNPMAGDGRVALDDFLLAWSTTTLPVHYVQVAAER